MVASAWAYPAWSAVLDRAWPGVRAKWLLTVAEVRYAIAIASDSPRMLSVRQWREHLDVARTPPEQIPHIPLYRITVSLPGPDAPRPTVVAVNLLDPNRADGDVAHLRRVLGDALAMGTSPASGTVIVRIEPRNGLLQESPGDPEPLVEEPGIPGTPTSAPESPADAPPRFLKPIFGTRYDAALAAERRWRRQAHPADLDPRARRARAERGAPRPRTANQSDKVSPSEPEGPPRLRAASPGTRPAPPPLLVDLPHMCWRARVCVFPSAKPPKPPKQTKKPTKPRHHV